MSESTLPGIGLLVDFEPVGRRAEIQSGMTLLEAARNAGVDLESRCGGAGSCGHCRIRLMSGGLNAPTLEEQGALSAEGLEAGYRLACQSVPQTDVEVDVPSESLSSALRLQIEGQEGETSGARSVTACDLEIAAPTYDDLRSDLTRLRDALRGVGYDEVGFSPRLLLTISDVLRANGWRVRVALRNGQVVGLLPSDTQLVGLAVDVGTTKIAGYLLDLETGATLAKSGIMNPQIRYGEDVISRIAYTDANDGGRTVLQTTLIEALNGMVRSLCLEASVKLQQIVDAVVVGNTAMHHLVAGLPVHQLAMAPYVPAVVESLEMYATDLGLAIAPGARVYLPPNIAGFVGADHVAMLLSTGLWRTGRTSLGLDIGTNTEVTLAHDGRLWTCSCASGPAFEGAHTRDGMRAAPGAIERVHILKGKPSVVTIGGGKAVGICGSGILDAVAEFVRNGIVDHRGVLEENAPNVRRNARTGHLEYLLVPAVESGHGRDVVVTWSDVREIQLAKSAIRAGIETVLEEAGIPASRIEEFVVAGAFGTYLDVDSAMRAGMFPRLPSGRFRQVGNAAGAGARQMLMSGESRAVAEEIRSRSEYVELMTHPGFSQAFMRGLSFHGTLAQCVPARSRTHSYNAESR